MKNIFKRIFNYPLIIIFSFSLSSFQRFFQTIFFNEILNYENYAFINLIMLLLTGLLTNFRAFLFFLVFGCENNVKVEIKNIFMNFLAFFIIRKDKDKDNDNYNIYKKINYDENINNNNKKINNT
jgi:hypothetical protein